MLLKYIEEDRIEEVVTQADEEVLRVAPDAEVSNLSLDELPSVIELSFPSYKDGRAFSQARALRELGYKGVLRATGDVLRDQFLFMVRCGFNEFKFEKVYALSELEDALREFRAHYQTSAMNFNTIWQARSARSAQLGSGV